MQGQAMNPPSLAVGNSEFAQQLMTRVWASYACCHSYMDEGEVSIVFVTGDERRTVTRPFSTVFVRPSDFRFEFRDRYRDDLPWNRHIVWQSGKSVLTWWHIRPDVVSKPTLSRALGGAAGVSGGSATRIPSLLMPDTLNGTGFSSFTHWKVMGEETMGNATAYKVHGIGSSYEGQDGRLHKRELTLWIDTQTLLILQTFATRQFEDFETENTKTYRPQMNIAVPPHKLHFSAPT
jgi:hypothetical protein